MTPTDSASSRDDCSAAIDLLAAWHDGYVNGMNRDEAELLRVQTSLFLEGESYLTESDPGDENDGSYGHGV
jgi:hypothetical protein